MVHIYVQVALYVSLHFHSQNIWTEIHDDVMLHRMHLQTFTLQPFLAGKAHLYDQTTISTTAIKYLLVVKPLNSEIPNQDSKKMAPFVHTDPLLFGPTPTFTHLPGPRDHPRRSGVGAHRLLGGDPLLGEVVKRRRAFRIAWLERSNKNATFGAPGIATNGARTLLGVPGLTRNKNATRGFFT